jgi:hypothetical protein
METFSPFDVQYAGCRKKSKDKHQFQRGEEIGRNGRGEKTCETKKKEKGK